MLGYLIRLVVLLLLPSAFSAISISAENEACDDSKDARKVVIDYYFEPGCDECDRVDAIILPVLEAGYAGFYTLTRRNLRIETNYQRLIEVLDQLGSGRNEHVFMVLDDIHLLEGYSEISERLLDVIGDQLAQAEYDPAPHKLAPTEKSADTLATLARIAGRFTIITVAIAGLIDGINPCAISVLVFFISLLSISRVRGRQLLLAGLAFCLASFLTYIAIGFGMFYAIRIILLSSAIQTVVELVMCLALLILAAMSFRDAVRYRTSRNPADISLQLPAKIQKSIHKKMRESMRSGSTLLAAFCIGTGVTLIDSVCTGQVYLPTLVYIVKSGAAPTRAIAYLLIYNIAFILPLIIVFIATYQGLKFQKLIQWSRRNVVASKTLIGIFFFLMAILIIIL